LTAGDPGGRFNGLVAALLILAAWALLAALAWWLYLLARWLLGLL
jgi:hypothetical protein